MIKISITEFKKWMDEGEIVVMDNDIAVAHDIVDDVIIITDLDIYYPETLLEISRLNATIVKDKNRVTVHLGDPELHFHYEFKRLKELTEDDNAGKVHVITIDRDNELIDNMISFPDTNEGNQGAERFFLEMCESHFINWDDYTEEDKEIILENGYDQNNRYKIMIHHD